jgi:Holliday junction resolvasome RuvABC endonuclease subunit
MSKSKLETNKRSFKMAKELWKIIKKYKPEHLIIEDTQQQNNVKTVITLARLQGMIIGYAEAHKIKVHILLPSQWRSALGFAQGPKVKREALKKQSNDYVKKHFGFNLSEDENEAICEGIAAHKIIDELLW